MTDSTDRRDGHSRSDKSSTRARIIGVLGLSIKRIVGGVHHAPSRQVGLTVAGVAFPIILMLVVTSVSLGLAADTTVQSDDVDFWIVPESGASSSVVSVDGPQFGQTHRVAARLSGRQGIDHATPVLVDVVRARSQAKPNGTYVLAVGIIPADQPVEIAGVSTAGLTPGDPVYANGTYTGPRPNETVLSGGASELLEAHAGDSISFQTAGTTQSVTVMNVSRDGGSGLTSVPVVLLHLGALQTVLGSTEHDRADQILVKTSEPGVRASLERVYPQSLVVSRGGLGADRVLASDLPLAVALAALVVAVVVGVLFAGSTMGLAIAADTETRAILTAIGFSRGSRALLVSSETLILAVCGGVVGSVVGILSLPVVDAVARELFGFAVTHFHPFLVAYGLGVALVIGMATVPYVLFLGGRTEGMGGLR